MRRAEQWRHVDVHLRHRPELEARTDEKFLREVAARAARFDRVHERELRLDPDVDLAVLHGVADAGRPLVRVLLRSAELMLPDDVAAPVPAGRDVAAQQQFAFEQVVRGIHRRPFEIDRRVAPDFSPVGKRPSHLGFLLADRERARQIGLMADDVEIELNAARQTEFHFVHRLRVRRAVAIRRRTEPVFEFDLALRNHVHARLAEQTIRGPAWLLIVADAIVFSERCFAEHIDRRHGIRVRTLFGGLLLIRRLVGLALRGGIDHLIGVDLLRPR